MDSNQSKTNKQAIQPHQKIFRFLQEPPNPYHVEESTMIRSYNRSDSGIASDSSCSSSSKSISIITDDLVSEKLKNRIYEKKFSKIPKEFLKEYFVKKEIGESILDAHLQRVYGHKEDILSIRPTLFSNNLCLRCCQEKPDVKRNTLPSEPKVNDENLKKFVRKLEEVRRGTKRNFLGFYGDPNIYGDII